MTAGAGENLGSAELPATTMELFAVHLVLEHSPSLSLLDPLRSSLRSHLFILLFF